MKSFSVRVALWILILGLVIPAGAKEDDVSLTVYNQNFGFVRVETDVELNRGQFSMNFEDVAASIDPTSVHFRSLTDPKGVVILEQNYEYDLISGAKLYEKFVGQEVSLLTEDLTLYTGRLGSTFDGAQLVLLDAERKSASGETSRHPVIMVRYDQVVDVRFGELPQGLITIPTLQWLLQVARGGTHRIEVSYIASRINWVADYVAVLEADEKKMDMTGWITVDNRSGKTYENARLKLLAGDVHRVEDPAMMRMKAARVLGYEADMAAVPQVQQEEFFEYHLYTLQRRTNLKDQQTKQIEFTRAPEVPVNKLYILESVNPWAYQPEEKLKVDVKLEFLNEEKGGLGIPLPKGKVRLFKRGGDGTLEFIGEDRIDHTPKDEKVKLQVGKAFDIVGERKQTSFEESPGSIRESYKISVRNHKKEPVNVTVVERFYRWREWRLTTRNPYQKVDAQTVEFPLEIPRDATGEIEYTVRYEIRR